MEHWARTSGILFEQYAELENTIISLQETKAYWAARKDSLPNQAPDKEQEAVREITKCRGLQRPIRNNMTHSFSMLLEASETANPDVFEKMRTAPSTVVRHTFSTFVANQLAKMVVSKGKDAESVDVLSDEYALAKKMIQDKLPQLNWRNRIIGSGDSDRGIG